MSMHIVGEAIAIVTVVTSFVAVAATRTAVSAELVVGIGTLDNDMDVVKREPSKVATLTSDPAAQTWDTLEIVKPEEEQVLTTAVTDGRAAAVAPASAAAAPADDTPVSVPVPVPVDPAVPAVGTVGIVVGTAVVVRPHKGMAADSSLLC